MNYQDFLVNTNYNNTNANIINENKKLKEELNIYEKENEKLKNEINTVVCVEMSLPPGQWNFPKNGEGEISTKNFKNSKLLLFLLNK